MADNTGDDDGEEITKITFRIDKSKADEFERVIRLAQGLNILDSNTSKSALLRQSIDEIVEDLYVRIEDQTGMAKGNLGQVKTATTTAD